MCGTRCIGADRTHQTYLHTHTRPFTTPPTNNPTCRPKCLAMNPGHSAELPASDCCFTKALRISFRTFVISFLFSRFYPRTESVQRPIYAFSDKWTERVWKEAAIDWHMLGRNKEDHENLGSGQMVCGSSCEFTTSWVGMTPGTFWTAKVRFWKLQIAFRSRPH